jgi:hypothetical protein
VLVPLVLFGILGLRILLPVLVFWHPDLPSARLICSFLAVICPLTCRIKP